MGEEPAGRGRDRGSGRGKGGWGGLLRGFKRPLRGWAGGRGEGYGSCVGNTKHQGLEEKR